MSSNRKRQGINDRGNSRRRVSKKRQKFQISMRYVIFSRPKFYLLVRAITTFVCLLILLILITRIDWEKEAGKAKILTCNTEEEETPQDSRQDRIS
ncbi:hypothetical protein F2Q68_00029792 [Brassica cretica]|uniref:Uncharacterized protein n=1 Tax=Brassica cretica TaxID=69181 RepID=A0A8S9G9X7_BRACR|nr:hypothetical protein F2Q68_00029792 [Brassica cretica]